MWSMWTILKHKLARLGCLFLIALLMIAVTFTARTVLRHLHYSEQESAALADRIGEYAGKGVFGLVVFCGFIFLGLQLKAELKARQKQPPPLPVLPQKNRPEPPPLPRR